MLMDQQKKMVLISSTSNDWPQIDDDDNDQNNNKGVIMGSSTTLGASRLMEKPGQEQLQQQQQALKCPRCDSSNTKFCYYNNYSLSQPRHFCKACKRYWTRGGTLRNVPVGGGCRKNKRVKRPSSTASAAVDNNGASSSASSAPTSGNNSNPNPNSHPHHPQIELAQHHMNNPLFYQPDNHMGININPFTTSGYDQFSALGLGFGDHQRFNPTATSKQIQDLVSLHSSNHSSIFNSTAYSTAAPTMASVLASKFINGGTFKDVRGNNNNQYFQNLLPFEDLQIAAAGNNGGGEAVKEVKVEDGGQSRMGWSGSSTNHQANNTELSSDPTLYWSSSNLGANNWHDPANLGSSVSSLI